MSLLPSAATRDSAAGWPEDTTSTWAHGAQVVDHFIGGQDEAESSSDSDSSEDERAVPRYWGRARGLSAGMASPHCAF